MIEFPEVNKLPVFDLPSGEEMFLMLDHDLPLISQLKVVANFMIWQSNKLNEGE